MTAAALAGLADMGTHPDAARMLKYRATVTLSCRTGHSPQNGPESPALRRYSVAAAGSRLT